LDLAGGRQVEFEDFVGDDAGAVEGVVEPEVGGEGVVRGGGDDAVFEVVAGGEAKDADGFDADVLVGGGVEDGGIGIVGDGAGKDVGGAAGGMSDVDEGDIYGLERAVVVEIEAGELADAEFVVDMYAGVEFFAAVAVGLEADLGFEELDLSGVLRLGVGRILRVWFVGQLLRSLLCLCERKMKNRGEQKRYCERAQ
jgi:hypothetical protein